ncbi:MAG: hypothetical protein H0U89_02435 [Acidimicrobiia bacterium]|nr:hypothetical protein [Acidimicrobiia bacterium]
MSTQERARDQDGRSVGAVAVRGGHGRRLGWLLLLSLLLLLLLAALALWAITANAGDDDAEGFDLSYGDCPSYSGTEGRNETAELAENPERFEKCTVAIDGTVVEAPGEGVLRLEDEAGGSQPIVVIVPPDADSVSVSEVDVVQVVGRAKGSFDAGSTAEDLGIEPALLDDADGQSYVRADTVEVASS